MLQLFVIVFNALHVQFELLLDPYVFPNIRFQVLDKLFILLRRFSLITERREIRSMALPLEISTPAWANNFLEVTLFDFKVDEDIEVTLDIIDNHQVVVLFQPLQLCFSFFALVQEVVFGVRVLFYLVFDWDVEVYYCVV